ncbi:hypothetical protein [Bacillus velezensis]|uniref:hypothetical protein n=1 Tax=Bacillus velezensis TaxID=492670 RepID=UPI000EFAD069|nr:hypothetical protein [Bacillus velezensis]TWO90223.1 hypothetical protein EUA42_17000 [Bacillus velezensis]
MARAKETLEPSFDKTCELIYKLASERISEKFEEWKKSRNSNNAIIDFYPSDRNLFGDVLNCKKTKKDNPYLLTPKLVEVILEELDFKNIYEVYWGDDAGLYFEELFTTLLLDMQPYNDYTKNWMGIPLTSEEEIRDFYREFILEHEPKSNGEYKSMKECFIQFTKNSYDYFELVNEVGDFIEESPVDNKEGNEVLTFHKLPKKIKIFAEEILLPFVSGICLNIFFDSFEENPTE